MSFNWGYGSDNGPSIWSQHFPEAGGKQQSPVDIKSFEPKLLTPQRRLTWKYIPENCVDVTNTGYCWKVHVHCKGSELTGGPLAPNDKYVLEQFHCHWGPNDSEGSEHTVDGRSFAGELHLVHWNATKYSSFDEAAKHPDGLCVLGVFLTLGKRHKELDKIVAQLTNIEYKGTTAKLSVPVDPASFLPDDTAFWTYQGSLTTPPCSECVIWIVFKQPVRVSSDQLASFRNLKSYTVQEHCSQDEFKGFVITNFRPTLPLGQRELRECKQ